MKFLRHRKLCLALTLGAAAGSPFAASAANGTDTWSGTSSSLWANPLNWTAGSANKPPISGDALVFGSSTQTNLQNNLTGSFSFDGITFNSSAPPYLISGNPFTLTGNITNNSTHGQAIANSITVTAVRTVTLTASGGGVQLSGTISGAGGGLTTEGAGTLTMIGTRSYTGITTISAGTTLFAATNPSFQSSGPIIINGAFIMGGPAAFGTGTVTFNEGSSLDISGSNGTNINTNPFIWAGSWTWGGSGTLNLGAGAVTASSPATTITLNGIGSLTFGGKATNASGISQTLTVNGIDKTLTIGGYILSDGADNLQVTIGGTGNITISGPITDGGTSTASSLAYSGTGVLSLSGSSTYHGTTSVNSGTVKAANIQGNPGTSSGFSENSAFSVNSGATLDLNSCSASIGSLTDGANGGGTVTNHGNYGFLSILTIGNDNTNTTFSGVIKDGTNGVKLIGLIKIGTGLLMLTGSNTYGAGTYVKGGKLVISETGSLGSGLIDVYGGELQIDGIVSGSVRVLSSGKLSGGGTINNSLTVDSGAIVHLLGDTLTINSSVINYGLFILSNGAQLAGGSASFRNFGTLDIMTAGTFIPPAGFQNYGTIIDSSVVKVKTVARTGNTLNLTIDSYTGHIYQLQHSASLGSDTCTNIGDPQTGATGTTLIFEDSNASADSGFYRIALLQ